MGGGLALGALLLSRRGPWPGAAQDLHPALSTIGTVCVVLYIALVGAVIGSIDTRLPWRSAARLAAAYCAAMLGLGICVTVLARSSALFGEHRPAVALISATAAILAVNGLPVVARLLSDQGRLGTPLGALALCSGALISVFTFTALRLGAVIDHHPLGLKAVLALAVPVAFAAGLAARGRAPSHAAWARRAARLAGRWLLPVYFVAAGSSLGSLNVANGGALLIVAAAVLVSVIAWPVTECAGRVTRIPRDERRGLADLGTCRGVVMIIIALQAHDVGLLSGSGTLSLAIAAVSGTALAGVLTHGRELQSRI